MKIPEAIDKLRNNLVWRHRFLWSYRADLYLLILIVYSLLFILFGASYIYSNYSLATRVVFFPNYSAKDITYDQS
jgi:hypothetical protein